MDFITQLWKAVAQAEDTESALTALARLLPMANLRLVRLLPHFETLEIFDPATGERKKQRTSARAAGVNPLVATEDIVREISPSAWMRKLSDDMFLLADFFDNSNETELEEAAQALSSVLTKEERFHRLEQQKEAAEAAKQAALVKLGRDDVSDAIVGDATGLKLVLEREDLVAGSDVPVLILGETGTGKELIARAIHQRSQRRENPFHRVNCGAIPPELIDSHLFGHERGSFTGATELRKGCFERADGGTLFLDEIGELPLAAQVRLLRILQDGEFERVGGQKTVQCDVRIVAATNRELHQMIAESLFREDLWYRIAVFPIRIPPLRERKEDIERLAAHFAKRAALRFGLPLVLPTASDLDRLTAYSWPGNIRELGTVIDRAAILGNGRRLEIAGALGSEHVIESVAEGAKSPLPKMDQPAAVSDLTLNTVVRHHIEAILRQTQGRIEGKGGAAELLDVNANTLRAKMRKLGIDWKHFR